MYDNLSILEDDLANIKEALEVFDSYSFSSDLRSRMASLRLSSSALAERCNVTHTVVDKWRSGKARPSGKVFECLSAQERLSRSLCQKSA